MSINIWFPDWRAETIADDVRQRIADHLDHLAVEFDIAAFDVDQHLLAELGRQVANHTREAYEEVFDALHARAGDRVAHLGDDRGQAFESAVHRYVILGLAQTARQLVAG
jgi:hypothetical protein